MKTILWRKGRKVSSANDTRTTAYPYPNDVYKKINWGWMVDPNEQVKNINLPEENIREFFNNIWGSFLKET